MAGRRILGIGVDVVDVARIARARNGRSDVLAHVCAPEEMPDRDDDHRAACLWSGKEAVAKALGTGLWQAGIDWLDIRLGRAGEVMLYREAARLSAGSEIHLDFAPHGALLLAVAIRWAAPT
jgi:phosphopantetheine--protein transferase-like protein